MIKFKDFFRNTMISDDALYRIKLTSETNDHNWKLSIQRRLAKLERKNLDKEIHETEELTNN